MDKKKRGGQLVLILLLSASFPTVGAGVLDEIKKKTEQVLGGMVDTAAASDAESPTQESESASSGTEEQATQGMPNSPSEASGVQGHWMGYLDDRATNHVLASAGFEVLLSDEVNAARVGQYNRRCLADLAATGKPGHYRATFLSGIETCGTSAEFAMEPDGAFAVTWTDAPGVAGKSMRGLLERKYHAHARDRWSSSQDRRKASDIVGFYPGMTYADALAHWNNEHSDLKRELRWVRDDGTSSAVILLSPKERAKAGQRQLREQITLGFETQTAEELSDVENTGGSANAEDLRRADARLLYVHRNVLFGDRKGPTLNTLKAALTEKYGSPSVDKKTAYDVLQWSFDKDARRISDAEGGTCDHWQRRSQSELAPNYKRAQTARVPYVTAHRDCGLTVKVRVSVYDGAVKEMDTLVYDQQRLMGDQWYGLKKFYAALLSEARAKAEAMEEQGAPDL